MITPRARLKDPKFKLEEETKYAEFILDILGIVVPSSSLHAELAVAQPPRLEHCCCRQF